MFRSSLTASRILGDILQVADVDEIELHGGHVRGIVTL